MRLISHATADDRDKIKTLKTVVTLQFVNCTNSNDITNPSYCTDTVTQFIPVLKFLIFIKILVLEANHHYIPIFTKLFFKITVLNKCTIIVRQNFRELIGKLHLTGLKTHKNSQEKDGQRIR